ncbi:hypothetical protein ABD76_07385 [Paenibacillus dendritiformis]|uniref:hypothetical protein n=1 Tax=Paenibacillus dendritiformis TaxID=130049 RepID=UPI0018CCF838|nr:hypothetical protein [Paenibacillus dendritiformis]MBG9792328.1 hypothetical protein [Paenibacillus dendritiformis]
MVRTSRNSISWPFVILLLVVAADISMLLTFGVALDFMVVGPLLVFWVGLRRISNGKLAAFARALAAVLAGYAAVRLLKQPLPKDELRHTAAPLFGTPNIMLELAAPVSVTGRFGSRRDLKHIALCLDQPHEFMAALEAEADGSPS